MTSLILTLALGLALAQPSPDADAAPGDALVDRFIAALPTPRAGPDPASVAALEELNPGRRDDIVAVLSDYEECGDALARVQLRRVAHALGARKVTQLVRFYEGEDFRTFDRIAAQPEAALSAADRAERDRILAAYPLADFVQAMGPTGPAFDSEAAIAGIERCMTARDAALAGRNLRSSAD